MNDDKDRTTIGHPITMLELLCIVLMVLKVTGVLDISWLVVLTPVWGPLALAAILFLCGVIGGVIAGIWKKRHKHDTDI